VSSDINNFNTNIKYFGHVKKNIIKLKKLYLFIFKIYGPKYIKILNRDEFQFSKFKN